MSTLPLIGFKGLKTSGNELAWPPGSLLQAYNCCIPSKDVLASRRGQPHDYAHTFGDQNDIARAMTEYQTKVVIHYGQNTAYGDTMAMATPESGAWTDLAGGWAAPDETALRMKFAQLAKNLYWTSSTGLGVLDGVASGAARAAGVSPPGDIWTLASVLSGNPDAGWMPKNSQVAYRAVIGRKDRNDNVKLSAPCAPYVVTNPADVTLAIGNLARAGTTVTAQVPSGHGFRSGDVVALSPGEANFAAGNYTLTGVTTTTVTWTNAGAAAASTAQQTLSSGTKNVALPIYLPTSMGIVAGDFVRLYRTEPSATASTNPGDECFLVYERTLTPAHIAALSVTITDTVSVSYGSAGVPLYCNANTGKGIAFTNVTPPLCDDVAIFDGRVWGTNTQGPHEATLRLIGVGTPLGIQSGDTIAVDSVVYSTTGLVFTTGNAIANINDTVQAIANGGFNFYGAAAFTGMLATSVPNNSINSLSIRLQKKALTGTAFYIASSRTTCWQDPMPVITAVDEAASSRLADVVTITTSTAHGLTSGDSIMLAIANGTTADALFPVGIKTPITVTGATTFTYSEVGTDSPTIPSGTYFIYATTFSSKRLELQLRFSEPGEPEAWPLVNYPGGLPDGLEVSRIATLRGSLFVFFRSGPTYTVSGTYPYNVQKFDGTSTLVAPDSLVEHNGRLLGLTTQGVCAFSESGVEVLSLDIEDTLRAAMLDDVAMAATFAVSYESDRQYILCLGHPGADATPQWSHEAYVYQSDQGIWGGRWTMWSACGLVLRNADSAAELLCMGSILEDCLRYESKTYTYVDDYDDVIPVGDGTNIDNTAAGVLEAVYGTVTDFDTITIGDLITVDGQLDSTAGHVTNVEVVETPGPIFTTVITTDGTFNPGGTVAIQVWRAISPLSVEWLAATAGAPAVEKQWSDVHVHADAFEVDKLQAIFTTERTQDTAEASRTLTVGGTQLGKWRFGTVARALFTLRLGVTQEAQRAGMLRVQLAFRIAETDDWSALAWAGQHFRLLGYSLTAAPISERTGYKSGVTP